MFRRLVSSKRLLFAAAASLLVVAPALAAPANASTIEVMTDFFPHFTYRAADGESNQVTFMRAGLGYVVADLGATISDAPMPPDCVVVLMVAECNGVLANWTFDLGDRDDTYAGSGTAEVFGGAGGDDLRGGGTLHGGPDADLLEGSSGPDELFGDEGDDVIQSDDGAADQVHCGDGLDTVVADALDVVDADCENVTVGSEDMLKARARVQAPGVAVDCFVGARVETDPVGPVLHGPVCDLFF